jgi:hypothetical protein
MVWVLQVNYRESKEYSENILMTLPGSRRLVSLSHLTILCAIQLMGFRIARRGYLGLLISECARPPRLSGSRWRAGIADLRDFRFEIAECRLMKGARRKAQGNLG